MDIKRIIANNIYTLRNKYKLTQKEFAGKLTVKFARGHISRIEIGNHIPSAEFIKSVSESFDVSADWILGLQNKSIPDIQAMTNDELELLFKFRTLPVDVQKNILNLIKSISKTQIK